MVLGLQLFALGLLGELIIFTHARGIKDYRVEEVIQYPEPSRRPIRDSDSVAAQPADDRRRATAPPAVTA